MLFVRCLLFAVNQMVNVLHVVGCQMCAVLFVMCLVIVCVMMVARSLWVVVNGLLCVDCCVMCVP